MIPVLVWVALLTLAAIAPAAEIAGFASLEGAVSHEGILIEFFQDGKLIAQTTTDPSGYYLLTGLPPLDAGENRVDASCEGYAADTLWDDSLVAREHTPFAEFLSSPMLLKSRSYIRFEWVYQPDGSTTLIGDLPCGEAEVASCVEGDSECSWYRFADTSYVHDGSGDVSHMDARSMGDQLVAAWWGNGGITDMGLCPLASVEEALLTGYEDRADAMLGHTYCVRMQDGLSYAKLRIVSGGMSTHDDPAWTDWMLRGSYSGDSGAIAAGVWPSISYVDQANGSPTCDHLLSPSVDEVVDDVTEWDCKNTAIALGPLDVPHIAYWYDRWSLENDTLLHATFNGSEWTHESVGGGDVGTASDIAVDAMGRVHMVFTDFAADTLIYACKDGAGWTQTAIESFEPVSTKSQMAIAVDGSGNVVIAYVADNAIKVAGLVDTEWVIGTIEEFGWFPAEGVAGVDIAIDGLGRPHIAYVIWPEGPCGDCGRLRHAWFDYDERGWHVEPWINVSISNSLVALACGEDSVVHIAYIDEGGDTRLEYARRDPYGFWTLETVATGVAADVRPGIATTEAGHRVYVLFERDEAFYALELQQRIRMDGYMEIEVLSVSPAAGSVLPGCTEVQFEVNIRYEVYVVGGEVVIRVLLAGPTGRAVEIGEVVVGSREIGTAQIVGTVYTKDVIDWVGLGEADLEISGGIRDVMGLIETSGGTYVLSASCPASLRVDSRGTVYADGGFSGLSFQSGAADVAEWVPVSAAVEPGEVLELDPNRAGFYREAAKQCSPLVAGVVSSQPGISLGNAVGVGDKALLALSGIVPVKVTNEGGPIQPGDLLVSSSIPGYAMRWSGPEPCPCALVGKALEAMTGERGVILVLLTSH